MSTELDKDTINKGRRWLPAEKLARIERLHRSGYNYGEIAVRVGHTRDVIRKIVLRGFKPKSRQDPSVPADFTLYATDETMTQLQQRYRRGNPTINRWLAEKGIVRPSMHRVNETRQCPPDFAELAPAMTVGERTRHWRAAKPTVLRWAKECGIPTPRSDLHARRQAEADRVAMLAQWKKAA